MAYRVVLFLTLWITAWTGAGALVGHMMFGTQGTGAVAGFLTALLTTFLWPWVVPEPLDNWMDGIGRKPHPRLGPG